MPTKISGDHPCRDVEEERRVRAVEGKHDQQRRAEDAQAVGEARGDVKSNSVTTTAGSTVVGDDQHREPLPPDPILDAMAEEPEEDQREDDPDRCRWVDDRPGGQPPQLAVTDERRVRRRA